VKVRQGHEDESTPLHWAHWVMSQDTN